MVNAGAVSGLGTSSPAESRTCKAKIHGGCDLRPEALGATGVPGPPGHTLTAGPKQLSREAGQLRGLGQSQATTGQAESQISG